MRVIEAPERWEPDPAVAPMPFNVFLAGGITGCPDWQQQIIGELAETNLVLFNPRRADFPIGDPNAAEAQIKWEYEHLRRADAHLFWFPCETLCPIVLYELGAWAGRSSNLLVGVHRNYQRRQDVLIQVGLVKSGLHVVDSVDALASQVRRWARYVERTSP